MPELDMPAPLSGEVTLEQLLDHYAISRNAWFTARQRHPDIVHAIRRPELRIALYRAEEVHALARIIRSSPQYRAKHRDDQ